MKITIDFSTEEERKDFLSVVSKTMKEPTEDLNVVETNIVGYVESILQQAYGAGSTVMAQRFFKK